MQPSLVAKILREYVSDDKERALLAMQFATELNKIKSFDELKFFRQCQPSYLDRWLED